MNHTVEFVNEWAAFEALHPKSNIEDFCRYYLAKTKEKTQQTVLSQEGAVLYSTDLILLKLMSRLYRMAELYLNEALKEIGIKKPEDFFFLVYIFSAKNPRKTEVIYGCLMELTTGLAVLKRLNKSGYTDEKEDSDDMRSKRVSITKKGELFLQTCFGPFKKVGCLMFGAMPEEDRKLCVQLLAAVENKHSSLWQQVKGKPFEEFYETYMKTESSSSKG